MKKLLVLSMVVLVHSIALADWSDYWDETWPSRDGVVSAVTHPNGLNGSVTANIVLKEFTAWDCWKALYERSRVVGVPLNNSDAECNLATAPFVPSFNRNNRDNLVAFKAELSRFYRYFIDERIPLATWFSTPIGGNLVCDDPQCLTTTCEPTYPAEGAFPMLDIEALAKAIPTFPHEKKVEYVTEWWIPDPLNCGTWEYSSHAVTNYTSSFFWYTPLERASSTGDDPTRYERVMDCSWDMCFYVEDTGHWSLPICNDYDIWTSFYAVTVDSFNLGNGSCRVEISVQDKVTDPITGVITDNSRSWVETKSKGELSHIDLVVTNSNINVGFTEADYGWETCREILKLMAAVPLNYTWDNTTYVTTRDYSRRQIEVQATDENGDPVFDDDGNPVMVYDWVPFDYSLTSQKTHKTGSNGYDYLSENGSTSGVDFVVGIYDTRTEVYPNRDVPPEFSVSGGYDYYFTTGVDHSDTFTKFYTYYGEDDGWFNEKQENDATRKTQTGALVIKTTPPTIRVLNSTCLPATIEPYWKHVLRSDPLVYVSGAPGRLGRPANRPVRSIVENPPQVGHDYSDSFNVVPQCGSVDHVGGADDPCKVIAENYIYHVFGNRVVAHSGIASLPQYSSFGVMSNVVTCQTSFFPAATLPYPTDRYVEGSSVSWDSTDELVTLPRVIPLVDTLRGLVDEDASIDLSGQVAGNSRNFASNTPSGYGEWCDSSGFYGPPYCMIMSAGCNNTTIYHYPYEVTTKDPWTSHIIEKKMAVVDTDVTLLLNGVVRYDFEYK